MQCGKSKMAAGAGIGEGASPPAAVATSACGLPIAGSVEEPSDLNVSGAYGEGVVGIGAASLVVCDITPLPTPPS